MRRLLLISYHFPPSEAAGALRWQRFAPIATAHGWQVEAITLAPGLTERADWGRVSELPPSVRIHGVTRPEPLAGRLESAIGRAWLATRRRIGNRGDGSRRPGSLHRKDVAWFRGGRRAIIRAGNVVVSHQRDLAWARLAIRTGLRVGKQYRPDLVLSCGPPHMVHEAGRSLAQAFGVPFVMDMRDPWSLQVRLQEDMASPVWFSLADKSEARCVARADLIVMNTPLAAAAMHTKWPRSRVMTVLNGWDEEPLPRLPWPEQFRVVYAGTIYLDRSPRPLFRAVAHVVRRLRLTSGGFAVRLIGSVESFGRESVRSLAADEGIGDYVHLLPGLPRQAILKEYAEAAVLLSLPQDSDYAIPSKVYEYMQQPCWVIAQTTPDSATGGVLRDTPAYLVLPDDVEGMTEILIRCYEAFRSGSRPDPIAKDGRFSRAAEGAKLMAALDSLVAPATSG